MEENNRVFCQIDVQEFHLWFEFLSFHAFQSNTVSLYRRFTQMAFPEHPKENYVHIVQKPYCTMPSMCSVQNIYYPQSPKSQYFT